MQDKGIKMLDGDAKFEKTDACDKDTNESKWPTIFAGGKVENAEDGEGEAKTTPKKNQILKRLLGGVVAVVSGVLLFK